MSANQIRQGSHVRRFDDGVMSRAAGLALILYGGISMGLIVALAASLRTSAAPPSVCTLQQPEDVSSITRSLADVTLTREARAR